MRKEVYFYEGVEVTTMVEYDENERIQKTTTIIDDKKGNVLEQIKQEKDDGSIIRLSDRFNGNLMSSYTNNRKILYQTLESYAYNRDGKPYYSSSASVKEGNVVTDDVFCNTIQNGDFPFLNEEGQVVGHMVMRTTEYPKEGYTKTKNFECKSKDGKILKWSEAFSKTPDEIVYSFTNSQNLTEQYTLDIKTRKLDEKVTNYEIEDILKKGMNDNTYNELLDYLRVHRAFADDFDLAGGLYSTFYSLPDSNTKKYLGLSEIAMNFDEDKTKAGKSR